MKLAISLSRRTTKEEMVGQSLKDGFGTFQHKERKVLKTEEAQAIGEDDTNNAEDRDAVDQHSDDPHASESSGADYNSLLKQLNIDSELGADDKKALDSGKVIPLGPVGRSMPMIRLPKVEIDNTKVINKIADKASFGASTSDIVFHKLPKGHVIALVLNKNRWYAALVSKKML